MQENTKAQASDAEPTRKPDQPGVRVVGMHVETVCYRKAPTEQTEAKRE